jgi:ribonuclease E
MIETSEDKKAHFGNGAPEAPQQLGRKPRAAVVIAEEPLQQVETQK